MNNTAATVNEPLMTADGIPLKDSLQKSLRQSRRRVVDLFGRERIGAPMNAQGVPRPHVLMNLHGFLWIDVHVTHEPARVVTTDGNQGSIRQVVCVCVRREGG